MKKLTAIMMLAALVLSLFGCAPAGAEDLMAGITPDKQASSGAVRGETAAAADFGLRLFRAALEEGNTSLSPLSVLYALAMTTGGAEEQTLDQMEQMLGMNTEEMDAFFGSYLAALDDRAGDLRLANAIWFTDDDRFTVNRDFLQRNADHYGADIFRMPLDETAVRSVNDWVDEKTDGMIEKILDKAPENAVMYLVNALAFDAKWENIYYEHQVRKAEFTRADGIKTEVDMMYSQEQAYLEDENATGFIKYYEGGDYAFVALLPNEGVTLADYLAGLTGESLLSLLSSPEQVLVEAGLPKFESEYSAELGDILKGMGMTDAFDPVAADFSRLGKSTEGNIFISHVIHKTFISVAEEGTRAGAATLVVAAYGAAMIEQFKTVVLNRPFVYLILDTHTELPLFIGTMMGK